MSNIAFDLEIFRQVANAVPTPGDVKFAALGSIGPDLYQYQPVSRDLSDALNKAVQAAIDAGFQPNTPPVVDFTDIKNDATLARELFEKPLMAAYSILFRRIVVPFWPIMQRDNDLLNQLQAAANAQDGDALTALSSSLDQLVADGDELKKIVNEAMGVTGAIGPLVAIPPAIESTGAQAKPWIPKTNRLFEFLRWHHTARFTQSLVAMADTGEKKAYAHGFMCHVAASVTGKPFINNIVGGHYRTHWWRNRLVSNFVDAWTFGRYETPATMSGDTPSLPYASWSNICTANLQERFNVAGLSASAGNLPDAINAVATGDLGALPDQFPQALADYIQAAIEAAHTPAVLRPDGFTPDVIKQSFVGLYAVVWFMTSGFGPMTPFDLGPAPSSCTTPPDWVTGGGSPPSPQQSGPSTGDTVCGVLLAILAAVLFIFGAWPAGIAAVVGAILEFTAGGGIDWDQLACNLFWLRKGLLDGQNALIDGLVKSGLVYPQPAKLGTVDVNGVTHPAVDMTANGGVPLTKSMPSESTWKPTPSYPSQLDASNGGFADLNFGSFPLTPPETPETMNLPLPPCYADTIIDGSGLQNGGMLIATPFPSGDLFFGDAVANAQQLIADQAATLPNYNLDADRGYGWKAWNPMLNTFPGSGQVSPKEEQ